jgi:hypothetical protein
MEIVFSKVFQTDGVASTHLAALLQLARAQHAGRKGGTRPRGWPPSTRRRTRGAMPSSSEQPAWYLSARSFRCSTIRRRWLNAWCVRASILWLFSLLPCSAKIDLSCVSCLLRASRYLNAALACSLLSLWTTHGSSRQRWK